MYLSQKWGKRVLDAIVGGVALTPPAFVTGRMFTVAPDETGGGTEVTGGGYTPTVVVPGTATNGSAGLVAMIKNAAPFTYYDMPVASSSVNGFALYDDEDDPLWINDAWSPPTWAIGANPQIDTDKLTAGLSK
jgi:hypothetical protein